ncbi:MAG: UDP-N-acetylglucosamine 2-epimerase, partial [Burkholderiaceae bacterium]
MSTSSTKVTIDAGARPNFMKIAPLIRAFDRLGDAFDWRLVHTGQHYDREMNDVFFEELGIPAPDTSLNCGGGSHATQTAAVMVAFEKELTDNPADWVIVVGDVNSTLACAIVAKKLHVNVAHVEAGLRSGDRKMPEEINRLVTDAISDLFFVTEPAGEAHLLREGHDPKHVHHVGHVMIDNLLFQAERLAHVD